ncbi:protein kinase superfamily protein [Carex rostrata]
MVFKGRFFSSSRKSSPDGSNSPKTPTQEKGSPSTRSDKKKVKSDPSPASTPSPSSSSSFSSSTKHRHKEKHKDRDIKELEAPKDPTNPYLSPILASSLGLNRIKTRSGPLLQEGLRGDHRMSGLGTGSNLSRGQTDTTTLNSSTSSSGKKDVKVADKKLGLDAQLPLPEKSGKLSTSRSHADEIKSPAPFTPESESTSDPYDTPKESESPRFKAIMQATSAPRKKGPGDIKSFSHELNSKGVRPYPNFWKPRGVYNLKEVLKNIQVKFEKAKEEVDSDLAVFAGELLGIMEKSTETHPEWKETLEDLLILARSCSMMTPGEFWLQCEGIVQDLDDHRQDLPMGVLKKLYTRMLFILTRCTRLLQFHKENGFAEDEVVLDLKGPKVVQSIDRQAALRPKARKSTDNAANSRKSYSQEQRLKWKQSHELQPVTNLLPPMEPPSSSREKITSWKPLPSPVVKKEPPSSQKRTIAVGTSTPEIPSSVESSIHLSVIPSDKNQQKVSWGYWPDQPSVSEESSIMCRICEEYVPTQYVEDHSKVCAIADKCDQKGLSVDERLIRIAEMLEKLIETYSQKDMNPSVHGESDGGPSPKLSDWSRRGSTDMLDCFQDGDINPLCFDDLKGLPSMTCKTRFGQKSDQGMATSSAGSMTPRSPLTTPRSNHFDMLLTGRNALAEPDDIPQIIELADIARCIANTSLYEEKSSPYLVSCMEDLQEVIGRRKHEALTVQTFGVRIEKLHQEKYLQLCDSVDEKVDSQSTVMDEEDDVVRSLRASPVHPIKDRTSIDDFEIIKPISRGAFGRVFLAKKRTTGDLFAIKVLKKADMIRKNAVESILAERDILITVRNPFVVRFFYSFTSRENLYLVMEYLNGGDLYSLLRNLGCLDEDVARIYIAEVVLALEYLHSNRIVHRDLKPDNLLLAHDGHIKLTDFGLSKVGLINSTDDLSGPAVCGTSLYVEDDHEHEHDPDFSGFEQEDQIERRKKRSAVGTPDYLAPEILLGTGHGASADWWSVGVILFELIVGIPPFNAEHPQMIFDNILNRKIPWPRVPEEMSTEAADLIDKLLTEDPHQRLGAKGASEVKQHIFFKDINWDTLARQKAAFVPSSDGAFDTSYFTSRYSWNPSDENILEGYELEVSSDDGSVSGSSSCVSNRQDDVGDECGGLTTELYSGTSVNYSFSNFSFKNLSQLASINYDLLGKGLKEDSQT